MATSRRQRVVSATLWSGTDVAIRQGTLLVFGIVLARLLTPEDFGTIGLLYLFVGLAGVFVDGGFGSALIQRQDVTDVDKSTVFWINLGLGCFAASVLALSAPWISRFFQEPVLVPLSYLFSFTLLTGALGSIHTVSLTKRLDFKLQAKIGFLASLVAGSVGILLAYFGFGVWALAAQTAITSVLTTLLLWIVNDWRPRVVVDIGSARKLFRFGSFMLLSALSDTAYNRLYSVLIGKFHGTAELGIYSRADAIKQFPVSGLSSMVSRVAFPAMSEVAGDKALLLNAARRAIRIMMFINVPVMFGMIAAARPLIQTLLGDQWMPAAEILMVLCLGGVLWPLHVVNINVLMAQGHSGLLFRLEVIKKTVGLALLAVGSLWGVFGIAWSQVAFGVLGFWINAYYTSSLLGYGVLDQTRDFLPGFLLAAGMLIAMATVGKLFWFASAPLLFAIEIAAGAVFFLVCARLLALKAHEEVCDLISGHLVLRMTGKSA